MSRAQEIISQIDHLLNRRAKQADEMINLEGVDPEDFVDQIREDLAPLMQELQGLVK